jgi:hypothetical protein
MPTSRLVHQNEVDVGFASSFLVLFLPLARFGFFTSSGGVPAIVNEDGLARNSHPLSMPQ